MNEICGMKTLVIHPQDSSTDFLDFIYASIPNKTLVTADTDKPTIIDLIKLSDRVMMMGHGSPNGLFAVGQFYTENGYVIDESFIPFLKNNINNFYIWCNANQFIERYKLKGFYTGMFISEMMEAEFYNFRNIKQRDIDESNELFSSLLSDTIHMPVETTYKIVKEVYGNLGRVNPIAKFNSERLYLSL